jgi:4-hydroxy-2-oxoheptanedioate aldolase
VTSRLRDTVRAGAPTTGTFVNLGSALATEVCAMAGFDWLLVDLEHGSGGEEALLGQLHAAAVHDVPVIVRTESAERIRTGRALDLGAAGIMFPRLETPQQAAEAIAHLHYPPSGDRGVAGYNRARAFGTDRRSASEVDESLLGVVQIETVGAVRHVDEIAATPGVDVLFVGPGDLSYALGVPGQLDARAFVEALDRVVSAARNAGVAAGILSSDPGTAIEYRHSGFMFIAIGSDSTLLAGAARQIVASQRVPAPLARDVNDQSGA